MNGHLVSCPTGSHLNILPSSSFECRKILDVSIAFSFKSTMYCRRHSLMVLMTSMLGAVANVISHDVNRSSWLCYSLTVLECWPCQVNAVSQINNIYYKVIIIFTSFTWNVNIYVSTISQFWNGGLLHLAGRSRSSFKQVILFFSNEASLWCLEKEMLFYLRFFVCFRFEIFLKLNDDITCFSQAGDLVLPNEAWKGDVCWFVLLSMFAFYSFLRISQMKHVDRKDSLNSKMIILAVVMYMFSTGQLLLANLWGVLGKSGKE